MDSDNEPQNNQHPTCGSFRSNSQPHSTVENDEPDDRSPDDAVLQLELAQKTERSARWTMVATVAIALGTMALAGATFHLASSTVDVADQTKRVADRTEDLAKATDGLVKLAREQGADTKAAIEVATRQAAAAEEANRFNRSPTVVLTSVTIPAPIANTKLNATVSLVNLGHSAARSVFGRIVAKIMPIQEAKVDDLPPPCTSGCGTGAMLFPSSGFQGTGLAYHASIEADEMTAEKVEKIKSKSFLLYIYGQFHYLDSDEKAHALNFCQFYNFDAGATAPCSTGNSEE